MHLDWTEVLAFVTGGICVWLTVRENVWNFPVGIANNIFFFALFFRGRLFADAWLQGAYVLLAAYGWWHWLRGGRGRTEAPIGRATRGEWLAILAFVPLATWLLRAVLLAVQGAAPFFDAATTVLSLAAQFLLSRKKIEHWWIWILADIIYIPLYVSRGLTLTAILYAVFLVMCVLGLREWQRRRGEALRA